MSRFNIKRIVFGLFAVTPLLAGAPASAKALFQDELTKFVTEIGFVSGRIDYCTDRGQALLDSYADGLRRFDIHPSELQALLSKTQAERERGRMDASQKFDGGPCPAETRDIMERAHNDIVGAWQGIAQNASSLDLRPVLATVLAAPPPATVPVPAQASVTPASSSSGLCVKGRAVSVQSAGQWYSAKVLDGPDGMGTCLVSYDGYGSNWDEWVSAQRMRPASSTSSSSAATGSAAAPQPTRQAQAPSTAIPAGKYSCYTFDNGMLNYSYTDVQILDGSRYAVGSKSGTYSLSRDGAMRFTGTMSNATGKFSVKSSGKPQIDLVFNNDARASMACSKAR